MSLASELLTIALSTTMTNPIISEFDQNRTIKTNHYRKRVHKRPNGDVGISVWTYETKRMNQDKPKDTPIVDEILGNIVPHEVGTNPYEYDTEDYYGWEESQRQLRSFHLYGSPFAHHDMEDWEDLE